MVPAWVMNKNWKEASNGRGTGVFVAWVSEKKRPHLERGHDEFDDTIGFVKVDICVQIDRVRSIGLWRRRDR